MNLSTSKRFNPTKIFSKIVGTYFLFTNLQFPNHLINFCIHFRESFSLDLLLMNNCTTQQEQIDETSEN